MKAASLTALLLTLAFASIGSSIPLTERQVACTNPIIRKEWRQFTLPEKNEFIRAVKCMQSQPAITTFTVPGAITKFDDFQGLHIVLSDFIHYVGQFLPWHRYYLWVYEKTLRGECSYTGGHPYWDMSLDIQDWAGSPIFDPTTGFGGNGEPSGCVGGFCTTGGCLTDGPFKDQVVHLGPFSSTAPNNYCLKREFNAPLPAGYFNPGAVAMTMSQNEFETFWHYLEGVSGLYAGQHGAGHAGVGGQMLDLYASPADPLFYLHHANIDRIWWLWQKQNLDVRLADISGRSSRSGGPDSPNVTLDYVLNVGILAPEVTIRDVMNPQGTVLCYDYV